MGTELGKGPEKGPQVWWLQGCMQVWIYSHTHLEEADRGKDDVGHVVWQDKQAEIEREYERPKEQIHKTSAAVTLCAHLPVSVVPFCAFAAKCSKVAWAAAAGTIWPTLTPA